jgi:hypothetical protein
MEINNLNLNMLHNEEHFQYQKEVKELVEKEGAKKLDIEKEFNVFSSFYVQEEVALNLIRKSATTEQIEAADKDRDVLLSGLSDAVKSSLKHFKEEKRAAAVHYKILLDQYGDIARKPYDDETAAIYKLVQESQGAYAADITTLGLGDWITEINNKNLAFETLKKDRYSEDATKTQLRMKTVRVSTDSAYKDIVKRINALILINGAKNHEAFVLELNSRIDKLNNSLAMRKGRSKKNGDQSKTENTLLTEKKK